MRGRLYRALLALVLPPSFRREWGAPMEHDARLQWAEARGSGRRVRVGWGLLVDAVRTGVDEWRRAARAGRGTDGRRGGGMVGGLGTDLRAALRALRRSPGFTGSVVLTLGLGIGALALVFTLIDAFLLRTLPYPEPDRLVAVWPQNHWSRAMVASARQELEGLSAVAGATSEVLVLDEGGEPVEIVGGQATVGYLDMLGARVAEGRLFTPDDEAPGAEPVTVLSHALWAGRFGSDPGVVGRVISLGGEDASRRRVVGVLPPGFTSPVARGAEAWIPVVLDPAGEGWESSFFMIGMGRLAEGASLAVVDAQVKAWAEALQREAGGVFSAEEVAVAGVRRLRDEIGRERRTPLWIAFGAASLVLLVACANVASLVLARTSGRATELSIRAALGSGRLRAARGVVVETLVLGAGGGLLGAALAALGVRLVAANGVFEGLDVGVPGPRVMAVVLGATALAALLAGAIPAWGAAGRDPARRLTASRGASGDRRLHRIQGLLAAAQLALALVGVTAAGLLGRSLLALAEVDPGFEADGLVTFRMTVPPSTHPGPGDVLRFHLEVRDALAATPGVMSAGLVNRLPMGRGTSRITVFPEGFQPPESGELPEVTHRLVTGGYLETLGARVIEGRLPGSDEERAEGVLRGVVNRAAAERFWPDGSAIGQRFLGPGGVVWMEIVAVVDDVRELGVGRPAEDPAAYIPVRDWPWRTMHAVVRTRAGLDGEALEAAVWSVAPGVPVNDLRPLSEIVAETTRPARLLALLALVVSAVTLALGAVGVYGVASYAASRRRREYGVRAALGAGRRRLLGGELRRAGRTVAVGVSVGLAGAWAAGRALDAVLFGVSPGDPLVLGFAGLTLAVVGLAAAWLPARRAAGADPVDALRAE
ncbi:MAG: ADOP family duplicated permease [Longimicrobiales bacterium]